MPNLFLDPPQSETAAAPLFKELVPKTVANARPEKSSFWLWASLFGLVALAYLTTTGFLPLVGRDEPRYVQIGREMLESGDWITPRLGGFTWFEKPVLLYWMVAASFGLFGVSEWAARLGPALCGLGSVTVLWWMTRRVDEKWARCSALSLATSGGLIAFSHGATFDIPLTFCITLALAGFFLAQVETKRASRYLMLFWAGIGLAFLAKGLVAFILGLGTIAFYSGLRREKSDLKAWWGVPLCLVVAGLWYGPVIWINGEKFVNEFFVQHHFARYLSDKYKHHQPPYFYLEMLPLLALPWFPFLVVALWKLKWDSLREDTPEARLKSLALAWLIVPIAFFSLSGSKLPGYVLPALPGAFLLIGLSIRNWTTQPKKERFALGLSIAMLLGVMVLTTTSPGVALAEKASVRALFETAREQGYGELRVVQYDTMQRTAQFYASSQLLYGKDGEPLRLERPGQIELLAASEPLLVLTDSKTIPVLQKDGTLKVKTVAQNREVSLLLILRDSS